MAATGIMIFIYFLFISLCLGAGIYSFVLFVKLANRGIKALDIYINEKSNK